MTYQDLLAQVFQGKLSDSELSDTSHRLQEAGVKRAQLEHALSERRQLTVREQSFFNAALAHKMVPEQILLVLWAPRLSEQFGEDTRASLMKQMLSRLPRQKEEAPWHAEGRKKLVDKYVNPVAHRVPALSALAALAGVVSSMSIYATGKVMGNPDTVKTAVELVSYFPSFVKDMLEVAVKAESFSPTLPALPNALVLGALAKFCWENAKLLEPSDDAQNDKIQALLSCSPQRSGLTDKQQSYQITARLLKKVPNSYQELLTHFTGGELRIFLHGNDALRTQMLRVNPPSYPQRLACVQKLHPGFKGILSKYSDAALLAAAPWDDQAHSRAAPFPVSLSVAIEKMRARSAPVPPVPRPLPSAP